MEINNYPNYIIYRDGRVQNKKKRFLKQLINRYGYCKVYLCNGRDKPKQQYIHRLVALNYIPNPENKYSVDHINRDKDDNRVENLRWASRSEQSQNRNMKSNNSSGHIGISYKPSHKKWLYAKKTKYKRMSKPFNTKTEALCFKFIYLLKIKSDIDINAS